MASSTLKEAGVPLGTHAADVRKRVVAMEQLLERSFKIPGTNQHVGLDAILGLIPVGGDLIAALMGLYMVWEARNIGMSKGKMLRMVGNVGFDWLIGLIPGIGDAADFFFRSNTRNAKMILRHIDKHHPGSATIDN
ncbi:DUF4112 domain-containing protein [Sphingosinithalassobacter tenebrarum]|uniref:DUF4112 domain-containing protein n=2 Tax=Stakelama tenebrarum TaxID=2711215 RepID=A0A6G6YAY4_9SPHN|nr:DUF4112 domain-containing protein [Sphingosinithalassobacter tenebrarum]QIG82001.1 DUF4112 domain-containing protein [Sphingosinithalassobacter tenebrarum]